jgi:hypothetical protein
MGEMKEQFLGKIRMHSAEHHIIIPLRSKYADYGTGSDILK